MVVDDLPLKDQVAEFLSDSDNAKGNENSIRTKADGPNDLSGQQQSKLKNDPKAKLQAYLAQQKQNKKDSQATAQPEKRFFADCDEEEES